MYSNPAVNFAVHVYCTYATLMDVFFSQPLLAQTRSVLVTDNVIIMATSSVLLLILFSRLECRQCERIVTLSCPKILKKVTRTTSRKMNKSTSSISSFEVMFLVLQDGQSVNKNSFCYIKYELSYKYKELNFLLSPSLFTSPKQSRCFCRDRPSEFVRPSNKFRETSLKLRENGIGSDAIMPGRGLGTIWLREPGNYLRCQSGLFLSWLVARRNSLETSKCRVL